VSKTGGIAITLIQWTVLALTLAVALVLAFGGFSAKAHGNYPFKFTDEQRVVADKVISVFENNSTELQYGYTEFLGDGRGITAGRAGFTTATGDLHEVVKRYAQIAPDHDLSSLLPELKKLKKTRSGSVENLDDLPRFWLEASYDKQFRLIQDALVDEYYYFAALEKANALGLQYPLSLLVLYDSAIQHGNGTDKDGLSAMIKETTDMVAGAPVNGVSEERWIRQFLDYRRNILRNPHDQSTQWVWSQSVGRVDALATLLDQQNYYLDRYQTINPWGTEFVVHPGASQ